MRRTALPLLLALSSLALAFAPAPLPRRPPREAGVIDLAALTAAEAKRLEGKALRYRVVLDGSSAASYGRTTRGCLSDRGRVVAAVSLPEGGGKKGGDVLLVRGLLSVVPFDNFDLLLVKAEGEP